MSCGPHRPYEGSQLCQVATIMMCTWRVLIAPTRGRNAGFCETPSPAWRGSSSPLRGVATACAVDRDGRRRHGVLIAPTRGRNIGGRIRDRLGPARPHRPYEGSQHAGLHRGIPVGSVTSSSPLRGVATARERAGRDLRGSSPHRPYEGSQPGNAASIASKLSCVLIAPTRGRNYLPLATRWRRLRSSSPLRGVATRSHSRRNELRSTGPHRPYEGSQHTNSSPLKPCGCGPHRPYEGSQLDGVQQSGFILASPHRPYEGSQP